MKILITGGTGTVGRALIKQDDHEYINVSRNEERIAELKRDWPGVKSYVGNIEDKGLLLRVFKDVKPDVVVQAEKTFGKENVVAFPETDNVKTINFGKHKGNSWAEVPIDYIEWLISKGSVDWQKEEAQQEKDRRNPSKPTRMAGGMSEAAVMEEEKLEEIPF